MEAVAWTGTGRVGRALALEVPAVAWFFGGGDRSSTRRKNRKAFTGSSLMYGPLYVEFRLMWYRTVLREQTLWGSTTLNHVLSIKMPTVFHARLRRLTHCSLVVGL